MPKMQKHPLKQKIKDQSVNFGRKKEKKTADLVLVGGLSSQSCLKLFPFSFRSSPIFYP